MSTEYPTSLRTSNADTITLLRGSPQLDWADNGNYEFMILHVV